MLHMTSRPVSRMTVVLPKDPGILDAIVDAMANELLGHGVHVARHALGTTVDAGFRADVALWWQGLDGRLPNIDRTSVHARVHVIVLDDAAKETLPLLVADAVLVVSDALREPTRQRIVEAGANDPPVVSVRIPLSAAMPRDVAKTRHHVGGRSVVLIDLTDGFERDIERVMIQLALVNAPHVHVLHIPHDEKARARARDLATRHGVDAYLASGPQALASSLPAADLYVGRPTTREVLVAASHGVAVAWLEGEGEVLSPVQRALRLSRSISSTEGVLHLAAFLERRLADRGGIETEGTLLKAAIVGEPRAFLTELGRVREQGALPRGNTAWELVGPSAGEQKPGSPVVDAKQPGDEVERAARIEDALRLLKERVREGNA
jgi:hypothetical protein